MNWSKHLHLARRDLSRSYRGEKDARPYAELQLRAQQAQAHALIALTYALTDAPTFEEHVRDALQVVNDAPVEMPLPDLKPSVPETPAEMTCPDLRVVPRYVDRGGAYAPAHERTMF